MSEFWNARARALEPYVPGEQPRDKQYVKLNTNESPYPPSPATLAAARAAASDALKLYPDPECRELREAVAARYGTAAGRVFAGNGSDEILGFAFGAFFGPRVDGSPGEPLLFPDVTYSFYPVYAKLWDVPFRTVPTAPDFSVDLAAYDAPNSGVVIANPNAPSGIALGRAELLALAEKQLERGRVLIVDEAYVDFGAESCADAIADFPNLLVVHTLSKSRSLAGLRAGYALGQEGLIEGLRRLRDSFNSYTMDRIAQAAAAAAVRDRAYYDEACARVAATRERTAAALRGLGFELTTSKANFLFASKPGVPGAVLFKALRDRGYLVRHFGKPRVADRLRISVGSDAEMDGFAAACAEVLKELAQ